MSEELNMVLRRFDVQHHQDKNDFSELLGERRFEPPLTTTFTLAVDDHDRGERREVVILGRVIQEKTLPLDHFQRWHHDDREELQDALQKMRIALVQQELEVARLKRQQGIAVEAKKDDVMLILGPEMQNLLAHAMEEAGLLMETLRESNDVFRVVTDTEEELDLPEQEKLPVCTGAAFWSHGDQSFTGGHGAIEMHRLSEGGWQCRICGRVKAPI